MSDLKENSIWILERESIPRNLYEETLSDRFEVKFFQKRQNMMIALQKESSPPRLLISSELLDWEGDHLLVSPSADLDILRDLSATSVSDFLIFPFNRNELLVRVEKILGRSTKTKSGLLHEVVCDTISRKVRFEGQVTSELTHRELQIFSALLGGARLSRSALIERGWGDVKVGRKTLDVHLFNLRRKIAPVRLEVAFMPPDFFELKFLK